MGLNTFDLSYTSLTGLAAQEQLQNLRANNPTFHAELTQSLPSDDSAQGFAKKTQRVRDKAPKVVKKECTLAPQNLAGASLSTDADVAGALADAQDDNEDDCPFDDDDDDDVDDGDDSEVPTWAVVEHVVHGRIAEGVKVSENGKLVPSGEAETAEPDPNVETGMPVDVDELRAVAIKEELGKGKRRKKIQTKYSGDAFWRH